METQGRSTFSRSDFSGQMGFIEELLLSHELAHQWFGDAVTPADWQDIWLNESFATCTRSGCGSTMSVSRPSTRLRRSPWTAPEPTRQPDGGTLRRGVVRVQARYDGGALVLEALRRTVGDDAFFETLQRWVVDNEETSRRTADFIALAEDVAGQELTEVFDDWLFAHGCRPPCRSPSPHLEPAAPSDSIPVWVISGR